MSNGIAGIVMGIAYRGAGLHFAPAALFSILVYSATAQSVILGIWSSFPSMMPMVFACIATNARYLVMCAHLHRIFGSLPKRVTLPSLFLLADASWMMTTADSQIHEPDVGYFLGTSTPMAIGWMGGTALGYALPLTPGGALSSAAALLPAAFIDTLLPSQWRGPRSVPSWMLAAATALIVGNFVNPSWAVLAGGSAGTLLSMLRALDA